MSRPRPSLARETGGIALAFALFAALAAWGLGELLRG